MNPDDAIMIYCPCTSKEEAATLAGNLLEARWVACANILPEIQSSYWWQGKIQSDQESVLILKTRGRFFDRVRERILSLHTYETPAILAWRLDAVDGTYLKWMEESLEGS